MTFLHDAATNRDGRNENGPIMSSARDQITAIGAVSHGRSYLQLMGLVPAAIPGTAVAGTAAVAAALFAFLSGLVADSHDFDIEGERFARQRMIQIQGHGVIIHCNDAGGNVSTIRSGKADGHPDLQFHPRGNLRSRNRVHQFGAFLPVGLFRPQGEHLFSFRAIPTSCASKPLIICPAPICTSSGRRPRLESNTSPFPRVPVYSTLI